MSQPKPPPNPSEETWKLFNLEESFLSACLIDRKLFVDLYTHILPEYFDNKNLAEIFKIFRVYFNKYQQLPNQSQVEALAQKINSSAPAQNPKIKDLKVIPEIFRNNEFEHHEVLHLRDEIKKFIKENKIKNAIINSVEHLKDQKFVEIEQEIKDAILWSDEVSLGIKMEEVEQRYEAIAQTYSEFIESPWGSLNAQIGGGFFKRQLYCVIANSSVGKSIWLDQCALHAWLQGKNVVLVTLELSELKKGQRIDASLTQISPMFLLSKKQQVFDTYKGLGPMQNRFFIKEFPTSTISCKEIERYIYQLKLYEGLEKIDLLVIDYGDLLLPNGKGSGNEYYDQGRVFEQMRALGQIYDCAILSASQINRSGVTAKIEDINESFLADSMKKFRTVDGMFALHNTPDQRVLGDIYLKFLKNRDGQKDIILPYKVEYEYLTIREISTNKKLAS